MTSYKLIIILAAFVLANGAVMAEDALPITANIGLVSNYMWRGLTQTTDDPAIQGGVDFAHESGFSLGTWASNTNWGATDPDPDPNYEVDVYGGYSAKINDFGYSLTTAYYAYPDVGHSNFWEIGASGSWNFLTAGLAYTLDGQAPSDKPYREGDLYYYASISYDLPEGFKLGGTLGHTNFKDLGSEGDYTNWQVSVSKDVGNYGTFNVSYDQNDGGDGEAVAVDDNEKIWVGWKKTF